MLEIFATAIAGLGLFFVGVHILTENLSRHAGPFLRKLAQPSCSKLWHRFVAGLVLGGLTQTTTVAVFILVGLTAAGLTTIKTGLPILLGVNIGTSALVFLGTLDTQTIALIVTGVVGMAIKTARFDLTRPLLFSVFSVGLFFIGIDLLQDAGLQWSQLPSVQQLLSSHRDSYLVGFASGILLRVVMMSGSAATLLLIGLSGSGIIDIEYTVITIYGVNFGAAVSTWLFSMGRKRTCSRNNALPGLIRCLGSRGSRTNVPSGKHDRLSTCASTGVSIFRKYATTDGLHLSDL